MKTSRRTAHALTMLIGVAACTAAKGPAPSAGLELPIAVHLLHAADAPALTTRTSDADARRVLAEANRIWSRAGISFVVDSVRTEEVVPDATALASLSNTRPEGPDAILAWLTRIRPPVAPGASGIHVYFIGNLPCNGITMPPDAVVVQDEPRLQEVPGGEKDGRARVLAHELGHVFGLEHVAERDRLLAPGSTGARLTDVEIAAAVRFVSAGRGR